LRANERSWLGSFIRIGVLVSGTSTPNYLPILPGTFCWYFIVPATRSSAWAYPACASPPRFQPQLRCAGLDNCVDKSWSARRRAPQTAE